MMSTKSPSLKPKEHKRKRPKEETKQDNVVPVHKSVKSDNQSNLSSDCQVESEIEENLPESNKTFIYEDKNDNIQPISRDISIDTGLQINSKIENGIIGFMEAEIKKEKSKYTHFTDSRPQSLSFYEEEKAPEELSGQLEQLSPEEKRVLKRRRDERKIDIELDASTYKEIQNVLNREKEEALLAGIMKSQKSKSRKKKQFDSEESIPGIGDSREQMIPNGKKKSKKSKKRESSPLPGSSTHKKKHRRREDPRSDIVSALDDLQDDVFEKEPAYDGRSGGDNSGIPVGGSDFHKQLPPPGTVYVQKKHGGFQATPRDRLFSSAIDIGGEEFDKRFSEMVPLELALSVQRCWQPLTIMCHGLLAGLALAHIIVTQSNMINDEFIQQYKSYSETYSAIFYLLCVVCTVSIFDKYDIKHFQFTYIKEMIKFRKNALVIGMYLTALIIHLVNTKHDDFINNYNYIFNDNFNSTTVETMNEGDMSLWINLSLWKSILVIVAWVFVALGSQEDMLELHLSSMERFIPQVS